MQQALDHHAARAALEWLVELGATEAIGETPVNRFEAAAVAPAAAAMPTAAAAPAHPAAAALPAAASPAAAAAADAVALAEAAAGAAPDLAALRAAISAYDLCDLRRGARNLVFADGNPEAEVMVVGEAPGRDEDLAGRPFVGRAGQLLDLMFAAIGRTRTARDPAAALYITNVMPWRPPGNREPTPEEMAMMLPFVRRHIALVRPRALVLMGNVAAHALMGRRGITALRGTWAEVAGIPALPMFHPAYLLRTPAAKRHAWEDLLSLRARVREGA
jgi:DNA polymerase